MAKPIHLRSHPFHTCRGRVYAGKMNWYKVGLNDLIVVIFHETIDVSQPVSIYWQFTGKDHENNIYDCNIHGIEQTKDGYRLKISQKDHWYDFVAEMDLVSMSLQMFNPKRETADPWKLNMVWMGTQT
ncbi:hypothetical protein BDZ91DRAFT_785185 [Kalaharituber pfeilii]|nr:hypothetical protein BDZ91DRAFT_785185 [Kalaharituber pfeilii]